MLYITPEHHRPTPATRRTHARAQPTGTTHDTRHTCCTYAAQRRDAEQTPGTRTQQAWLPHSSPRIILGGWWAFSTRGARVPTVGTSALEEVDVKHTGGRGETLSFTAHRATRNPAHR